MCLGVPGKIVEIYETDGIKMGKIDFSGIKKEVCLEYLPDIQIDDYAIVHVGFAITQLDEASALETLAMFEEIGMLEEELLADEQASTA